MKKKIYIAIPLLVATVTLVALFVYTTSVSVVSAEDRAQAAVAQCSSQSDRALCYERLVPELYPELAVGQVFDVVRIIRNTDPEYQFCHVLAHKLGERIVAEDPSKWVNAMPLNPTDGYCSNGFIHGVIGGRFRAEVLDDKTIETLLPDFRRACEPHDDWKPSDLDKAMCYHAMGHLYVYIVNADLNNALSLCERTMPDQYGRVCREGVFMQIYQPLEPDDFALIDQMTVKPTPGTVRQFCSGFTNTQYEGACLRESWPMHQGMLDGTGIAEFCSGQPNAAEEGSCYESATAIVGRMSLGDPKKAASACLQLVEKWHSLCFTTIAQTVLEENRNDASGAVAMCRMASGSAATECITTLVDRATFIFGSNASELQRFCAVVPPELRERCSIAQ